eukprot:s739_g15.t5
MFLAYPKSRIDFTEKFRKDLVIRISFWTSGICPEFVDTSHWKLNLGGGDVAWTGSIGIAPDGSQSEAGDDYSENFDETGSNESERSNEAEDVAESVASAESGSFSYTEEFDATVTSKSEALLDEAAQGASASASAQDLSISEDVDKIPEVSLEAQRQERCRGRRAVHRPRQEIARRQEADAQRTAVLRKVSDASFDDISEETQGLQFEMPSGEDASEASNSFYDPEAKRKEEELERLQKEEEERKQKELEAAEAERKQQQIQEANRRLAAERKKKLEEEEARRRAEEERLAEQRRKTEEEKKKQEEEKRKRDEEIARNLKEEQLRKEEELRKEQQEERRALEKRRDEEKRQEEQRLAEQRLAEQRLQEQSRQQSPAKSHQSHQSDSITPEPRLEGLEGPEERSAPNRTLFMGPVAQDTTKMATFSPEKCAPSRTSPVGREMPKDETVSDEPMLRVGTLQSFEKGEKEQKDVVKDSEKIEARIPTTSLEEPGRPTERVRHQRETEETLWDRSEGGTLSGLQGLVAISAQLARLVVGGGHLPSQSASLPQNLAGFRQDGVCDAWILCQAVPFSALRVVQLFRHRLQQLQGAEGVSPAFSPPTRTATPSHTFQTDTNATGTAGGTPQPHASTAHEGTRHGLALPLPERPRLGGSAGPLPALQASKAEVEAKDATLAAPFRRALEAAGAPGIPDSDFEESLQWAVMTVLDDMMQLKYGCSMDFTALRRHLSTNQCWKVEHLNGIEFVSEWGSQKVQLQIGAQELNFQELRAVLRHFSGTACAVLFDAAGPGAALRLDAAGHGAVGRRRAGLMRVAAEDGPEIVEGFGEDLSCAWALEPTILGGTASTTTVEWQQLYAAAQKGETQGRSDSMG